MSSGPSASTCHHAHLYLSIDHTEWPLSIGLCACLAWLGSPPRPRSRVCEVCVPRAGFRRDGPHTPRGQKHPCGWCVLQHRCSWELVFSVDLRAHPAPGPERLPPLGAHCSAGCVSGGEQGPRTPAALPRTACWKITPNHTRALPPLTYLRGRLLIIIMNRDRLSGAAILATAVGSPGPASRLSTRPQRRPL